MYNSTACFFSSLFPLCFFHKHTLILLPAVSDKVIQGKKKKKTEKKEDCLLGEQRRKGVAEESLVAFFLFPSVPRRLLTLLPCCSTCRDTYRLSHGRTLPAEQSPTPILLANCQPVISNGHSGPDAHRIQSSTRSSSGFVPEPDKRATVVSTWILYFFGVQYKCCFSVHVCTVYACVCVTSCTL